MTTIPPAIRRRVTDEDIEATVISEPYNSVHFVRGWGDSGRKVQIVEMDCPSDYCSWDRMVRLWYVNAEDGDTVQYWCLNPNCRHFIRDELSWAFPGSYPNITPREPLITE